jgi:hypothetical protein
MLPSICISWVCNGRIRYGFSVCNVPTQVPNCFLAKLFWSSTFSFVEQPIEKLYLFVIPNKHEEVNCHANRKHIKSHTMFFYATVLAYSAPTNPCNGTFKCFSDGHGHIEYTTFTNTIFLLEVRKECTLRDATTMSMSTWLDLPTLSRLIQSINMHIKVGIVNGYMYSLCTLRTTLFTTPKQKMHMIIFVIVSFNFIKKKFVSSRSTMAKILTGVDIFGFDRLRCYCNYILQSVVICNLQRYIVFNCFCNALVNFVLSNTNY